MATEIMANPTLCLKGLLGTPMAAVVSNTVASTDRSPARKPPIIQGENNKQAFLTDSRRR